jgi:predicted metalloprotease with PDZ domain
VKVMRYGRNQLGLVREDNIFDVSDFVETSFTVQGKPHRIVKSGEGNYDLPKMAADFAKIVEESSVVNQSLT